MTKYSISFSRKVQTRPYENMTATLTEEFDDTDCPHDVAFREVRDRMNQWLDNEVEAMGLKK